MAVVVYERADFHGVQDSWLSWCMRQLTVVVYETAVSAQLDSRCWQLCGDFKARLGRLHKTCLLHVKRKKPCAEDV